MTVDQLLKKIGDGEWSPHMVLVYGEENLGVEDTSSRILSALRSGGASRITLDGKRFEPSAVDEALAQMTLFAERRVIYLNGVPSGSEQMNGLVERIENRDDLFLVVRHSANVDRRLRWYKKLASGGAVFQFEAVKERDVPDRIQRIAASMELQLPIQAAQALASRVGTDLLTARNEVEKLGLYVSPRNTITIGDIEAAVGRSRDTILYEITEGIASKDRAQSLSDLKDLLRQGVSAGAILSLLAREVRFLLQAGIVLKEEPGVTPTLRNYNAFTRYFRESLSGKVKDRFGTGRNNLLRQHPYVAYLRMGQASRFSRGELFRLLRAFSRADRSIKSGIGTPETVLFTTIAAASSGGRR